MGIRHSRKKGKNAVFVKSTNLVFDRFFQNHECVKMSFSIKNREKLSVSVVSRCKNAPKTHSAHREEKKPCRLPGPYFSTTHHTHKKTWRHTYTHTVYECITDSTSTDNRLLIFRLEVMKIPWFWLFWTNRDMATRKKRLGAEKNL